MRKKAFRSSIIIIATILLLYSFYINASWMELCAGLAFFLFGMQSMQEGLTQLAGGKLNRILAKSTETPLKSLFFGISSTVILQSTTVVSLLIIAFISTGLITLSAGIGIIIGANVGSSAGMWLLALAGQNVSLSPFAYPMVIVGILASFAGKSAKSAGRIIIGVAFILLAIDLIKNGFSSFTDEFDILAYDFSGWAGILLLVGIGLVLTVILQSSHATIMLILTMLSLEQISSAEGFALTIGAIVGSALATGILGFLGGDRAGMRVASSHVIFNAGTGVILLILFRPVIYLINIISIFAGFNSLIQIALFYTLFNIIGLLIFWPLKNQLAKFLEKLIPDLPEPKQIVDFTGDYTESEVIEESTQSRFLIDQALSSTQTATKAVMQELGYLSRISLEVICHILYLKTDVLSAEEINEYNVSQYNDLEPVDADLLYHKHIKNVYSELLTFISKVEYDEDDNQYQEILSTSQIIAFKLVSAVKNSYHLQKNLHYYLYKDHLVAQKFYLSLRHYIINNLRTIYQLHLDYLAENSDSENLTKYFAVVPLTELIDQSRIFENDFRIEVYNALKENKINGLTTSSILNDLSYSTQIVESLFNILQIASIQSKDTSEDIDEILQITEDEM